ncbi:sensor histidine kinase [Streptomyces sp. NPDC001941]|uniref:sensor histidine kinase n=1 Tax=Streptomyces sp. NPDC001941 TaxID=3154659 RepID=UPI00331CF7F7
MRGGPTPHKRLLVDAGIALALLIVMLWFLVQYHPEGWRRFDGPGVLLTCLVTLPLALRRLAPWPVLLTSCAGLAVYVQAGYQPSSNMWPPLLAFLTIASLRPHRETALAAAVTGAAEFYHAATTRAMSLPACAAQTLVIIGLAWGFGLTLRRLAERNRELDLLTEQLKEHEGALARQAVTEERLRIARELHDVTANHLSVVSVQSGLARYLFDSDPPSARNALGVIEDTVRRTLEDLRGVLRVLRITADGTDVTDEPSIDAVASLVHLGQLVDRMTRSGLSVETRVTGTPRELAAGPDLCAYRIIQEALTNTLKHAGARPRVWIALAYAGQGLTVTVTDDGGGTAREPQLGDTHRTTGSGHGLIGMNERVKLYGGSFRAGPRPPVGYQVEFTLPTQADPVRDAGAPVTPPPDDTH